MYNGEETTGKPEGGDKGEKERGEQKEMLDTWSFSRKIFFYNKLCPQSVLKHSVGHSQGIGMKFESFFFKHFF